MVSTDVREGVSIVTPPTQHNLLSRQHSIHTDVDVMDVLVTTSVLNNSTSVEVESLENLESSAANDAVEGEESSTERKAVDEESSSLKDVDKDKNADSFDEDKSISEMDNTGIQQLLINQSIEALRSDDKLYDGTQKETRFSGDSCTTLQQRNRSERFFAFDCRKDKS